MLSSVRFEFNLIQIEFDSNLWLKLIVRICDLVWFGSNSWFEFVVQIDGSKF